MATASELVHGLSSNEIFSFWVLATLEKLSCRSCATVDKFRFTRAMFLLNAKKVQICKIMFGRLSVKIQQCVKKSGGFR